MTLLAPAGSTASRTRTEQAQILQSRFREDWRFFYKTVLGGGPLTTDQERLWDSVAKHLRTLATSGHATGKDYDIGRIVPWFLCSYSPSIVITTAPTDRQVDKIIWGEIHNAVSDARVALGGRLLDKEWHFGDKYYAIGFTSKDTQASSQHFQGFHQANVLIILSEAPGIHDAVWDAVEGLTTGAHVRVLAVGQPIGEAGQFYDAARKACRAGLECRCRKWHLMRMSSWDAAAEAARLKIDGLASTQWCEDRKAQWGEDSPLYISRVLGEFPATAGDRIIALAWAARAQELELPTSGACGLGIDVAGSGSEGDATDFCVVRGRRQTRQENVHGLNTLEIINQAVRIVREEREQYPEQPLKTLAVDVGYNPGVYDGLWGQSEELGLSVFGIHFGVAAEREAEYFDHGTEMWWSLREDLRVGTFQLLPSAHPESEELLNELTSRRLSKKPDKRGRIRLESKDEMKRRGAHSPDRVDGLLLAREACRLVGSPMLSSTGPEAEPSEDEAAVWTPA